MEGRSIKASFSSTLAAGFVGVWVLMSVSCDPLLLAPSPRANWNDPDQGVIKPRADLYGDSEIRLSWDWIDGERESRGLETKIDEIVVKHRQGTFPATRLGGTSYRFDDWDPQTNPLWSHVFDELKSDRTHYFAVYQHEKGGRWLAPLYAREHLGRAQSWSESGVSYYDAYDADSSIPDVVDGSSNLVSTTNWNFFFFDAFESNRTLKRAKLRIEVTGGVGETLYIHPIRVKTQDVDAVFGNIAVDRTVRRAYTTTALGIFTIDITDVAAKAFYHGTGGIALIGATAAGVELDYVADPPELSYTAVREE